MTSTVVVTASFDLPRTETVLHELYRNSTVTKSFLGLSKDINRTIRASQDLRSAENCFLDLSKHINRLIRASQDNHRVEN